MQAILIIVVIVKKQAKKESLGQEEPATVHVRKPSHYQKVSQKRKRMTFLYHESREQPGRSRPRRKSEHKQGWCTETLSRWNNPDAWIIMN